MILLVKQLMLSWKKRADKVTAALNTEFAGRLAEIYYKGVREAIDAFDPGMMYLGTRLHGTPKYMKNVVEACGKYCDIVSINYYSRWSPELDTYVQDWATWAGKPFLVTEFYTKGTEDSDLNNLSGAGFQYRDKRIGLMLINTLHWGYWKLRTVWAGIGLNIKMMTVMIIPENRLIRECTIITIRCILIYLSLCKR